MLSLNDATCRKSVVALLRKTENNRENEKISKSMIVTREYVLSHVCDTFYRATQCMQRYDSNSVSPLVRLSCTRELCVKILNGSRGFRIMSELFRHCVVLVFLECHVPLFKGFSSLEQGSC